MYIAVKVISVNLLTLLIQAQAFASWKELIACHNIKRTALADSVRRLLQGTLGRAFAAWSSRVRDKALLKQKAAHCLARLTHAHAASAFSAWVAWAVQQKDHRSVPMPRVQGRHNALTG